MILDIIHSAIREVSELTRSLLTSLLQISWILGTDSHWRLLRPGGTVVRGRKDRKDGDAIAVGCRLHNGVVFSAFPFVDERNVDCRLQSTSLGKLECARTSLPPANLFLLSTPHSKNTNSYLLGTICKNTQANMIPFCVGPLKRHSGRNGG